MKRLLPFLFCLPVLNTFAQSVHPAGVRDCIARYDFSSTANSGMQLVDVSGNAHAGSIYNTFSTTGWRGGAHTAMKFDGQSSYVQVAHTPLLAAQTLTLVGLVRFDGFYSGRCQANSIIAKGYPHRTAGTYGLYVMDQAYDNDCYTFTPSYETTSADLGATTFVPNALPAPIQPDQWYFTAVSFDGAQVAIYQQLMDSTTGPPTNLLPVIQALSNGNAIGTNTLDLVLGRTMHTPYPYWFNGVMDEVAVFNRGLTKDEVFSIYRYLWGQTSQGVGAAAHGEAGVRVRTEAGGLFLESTDGSAIGNVRVYNLTGQTLLSGDYPSTTERLDVSAFPKGMLFIKLARKGAVATLKADNL